jgi:hypothetical protein
MSFDDERGRADRARDEHLTEVERLSRAITLPETAPVHTTTVDKTLAGIPGRSPLFASKTATSCSRTGFVDARADSRGRHLGKATLPPRTPPEAA